MLPTAAVRVFPGTRPVFIAIFLAIGADVGYGSVALDELGLYLKRNGYGGAQLVQAGNFYVLPIRMGQKRGSLLIDTGSSATLIFRASVRRFRLVESRTTTPIVGAFGRGRDVLGITNIKELTAGNCTLTNVPVQVATGNPDGMLERAHSSGLLGLRELLRFRAVLDLRHHLLYLQPSRSSGNVSREIRSILLQQGYTPVSLSLRDSHLRAAGALNGVPCHFVVDTGGYLTMLSPAYVARAKLKLRPTPFVAKGLNGSSPVGMVIFPSLRIGNYEIGHGSASVSRLDPERFGFHSGIAGLIGIEYLAMNCAVFDFINGTLYLKPLAR
jgi:predicted aspartyl protease